jgi:hypothetical protein
VGGLVVGARVMVTSFAAFVAVGCDVLSNKMVAVIEGMRVNVFGGVAGISVGIDMIDDCLLTVVGIGVG